MGVNMKMTHTVDLNAPLRMQEAKGLLVTGDNNANTIILEVVEGGKPADLTGCSAMAYMIRADGNKPFVQGAVEGSTVTVCLNDAFYAVPGRYYLFVRLTHADGTRCTLLWMTGWVNDEGQGNLVDTENVVPSLEELLYIVRDMEESAEMTKAFKGQLDQLSEDVNNLNQGGLAMKEDFIGQQVTSWLDAHPEATTTVQDGAITPSKLHKETQDFLGASVSVKAFGAKGDGLTDDTAAFQAAADSGCNVFVPQEQGEKYRITNTIRITKQGQKWTGLCKGWDYGMAQAGIYAENVDMLFHSTAAQNVFSGLNIKNIGLAEDVWRKGTAICIDSTAVHDNNDSVVSECSVDYFETAVEMHGRGFTVQDCFFGGTNVGIKSYYSFDGTGGNDWQKPDTGFRGISIRRNKFHTCLVSCISFYNDYPFNVSIEQNIYDGGGSGYFVTFEGSVLGALINGNSILSCYAIRANGALADGIVFTGNDVGAPKAGLYTKESPVIFFPASTVVKNLLVSGNTFKHCPDAVLQISNSANTGDYHAGIICTSNMILNPCNIKTSGVQGVFIVSKCTDNIVINNNAVICNAIPADMTLYLLRSYGGQMAPKNSFIQGNSVSSGLGITFSVSTANGCTVQAAPV